ncbi:uncharacterized low-complexity protein [Vibrio maritimus]|uniref:Uncharacterized low-complexity protein n=1 Tax=Vibrio maritimus TaxID=990268 RepID=A0A090SVW7_9VIBR|nr:uncharacterized low-complexity protein [Vibrio maritimus]
MKKAVAVLAVAAAMASPLALAESTPVMFSSLNGFNAPDANAVGGVRLAVLHGQVNEVKGVDFSVLGMSETQRTTGVNFGLFFGASKVTQEMKGASLGIFNWNTGKTTGVNLAAVNVTNDVSGLNWSAVNYSEGYTMLMLVSLASQTSLTSSLVFSTRQTTLTAYRLVLSTVQTTASSNASQSSTLRSN